LTFDMAPRHCKIGVDVWYGIASP